MPKSRTVRTAEPNSLKPEPKVIILVKPVGTGTECVLKIRTGTEEFWNRPSTNMMSSLGKKGTRDSSFMFLGYL